MIRNKKKVEFNQKQKLYQERPQSQNKANLRHPSEPATFVQRLPWVEYYSFILVQLGFAKDVILSINDVKSIL